MSFANAIASASVLNRKSGATGPNVSSRATAICGVAFTRIVGSKKRPPNAWRCPPAITFAPFDTASLIWLSTFSTAALSISGPCEAPASSPGAGFSFFTAVTSFSANAS